MTRAIRTREEWLEEARKLFPAATGEQLEEMWEEAAAEHAPEPSDWYRDEE